MKGRSINNKAVRYHKWYEFFKKFVENGQEALYQFTVCYYLNKEHSQRENDEENEERYNNMETKKCVEEVKEALKSLKEIYDEIS